MDDQEKRRVVNRFLNGKLVNRTRAYQLVREESGNYLMEIRDTRRQFNCSFRLAVGKLARLYRGAIRAGKS